MFVISIAGKDSTHPNEMLDFWNAISQNYYIFTWQRKNVIVNPNVV